MEVVKSIQADMVRHKTGAILGGLAGLFISTKLIKSTSLLVIIPTIAVTAALGASVEGLVKISKTAPKN